MGAAGIRTVRPLPGHRNAAALEFIRRLPPQEPSARPGRQAEPAAPGGIVSVSRRFLQQLGSAALLTLAVSWSALGLSAEGAGARADVPVDLELVLALDASGSIDGEEFKQQIAGLASAFRDPRVLTAIEAAGEDGIAISVVQWAGAYSQTVAIDWQLVRDPSSAEVFAQRLDGLARLFVEPRTSIAAAIDFARRQLRDNGFAGQRQVVDISGDGRHNQGVPPSVERDRAVAEGVTINGLAILDQDPTLEDHYRGSVIGGSGAFVIGIGSFADFAEAIVRKLVREISGSPIARRAGPLDWAEPAHRSRGPDKVLPRQWAMPFSL